MDAQFLIQATFGPTRASLAEIGGMDYDAWFEAQLALAPTLLRSHYRTRANPQVSEDKPAGVPRTACEPGSRWMQVTFMSTDVGSRVVANGAQIFVAGALRTSLDASYTKNALPPPMNCSSIGRDWWQWHPHRTCANQIRAWTCSGAEDWTKDKTCQQECFDGGYRYGSDDCSPGWPNFNFAGYLCSVVPAAAVGSQIELSVDAACEDKIVMLNPGLYVPGLADVEGGFQSVRPSVIVLQQPPSTCDLQEFIQVDGQTFQHEPRLKLLDVTTPAAVCVAVPKTPLNVEACEVQAGRVCNLARGTDSALILNSSTLQLISEHANRHVFTVSGLSTSLSPCGTLARWKLLDCSTESCSASTLEASDLSLIRTALSTQVGSLRDVYVNCASVSAGAVVEVGSDTFLHVHIHEGNVYDFTEWVSSHPGAPPDMLRAMRVPKNGALLLDARCNRYRT
ncbi:rbcL [Symbiodinium sp. CCMP2592]|nr:rbcL [Symbiodinium sp. CCMP2592]